MQDNEINNVTTTQMVVVEGLIKQSKKDIATATATAKKSKTPEDYVELPCMTREEAKREANWQNITNQTIVGTKEGVIKVMKKLIGGNILNTVTKSADASRDRSIDDYKLHEIFQVAYNNALRPEVDDVLELVVKMYQYNFDFRKPIKHSMAQFKSMAN